jgi:hypothetical protein
LVTSTTILNVFRAIASIYPHTKYDPKSNVNDILVFKVAKPFVISPTVQLVKMVPYGFEPDGNFLTIINKKWQITVTTKTV